MKIAEIFYSIQGEGGLLGMPSVFVRTSGCNLRCTWCDTPYTSWQPEGRELSIQEITEAVAGFSAAHVVLTGGEPMISPQIVSLTNSLRQAGHHLTIETAGTVYAPVACDLMSISPKLSNSTPHLRENGRWAAQHDRLRYQPAVLQQLMQEFAYQLKFVVQAEEDLQEIDTMVAALSASKQQVMLMPEGTSRDTIRDRGLWLAEVCKTRRYRYSPRLHVDLWGDRRGV